MLTKRAVDSGMDPGLLVVLRDSNTAWVVVLAARKAVGAWTWPRPEDRMLFLVLGTFGLYFGQYFVVVGLQHGTPVLATTWANLVPIATYLLGLVLGSERLGYELWVWMKMLGVMLGVSGAVLATLGRPAADVNAESSVALASSFFCLQVLFGGAAFWHLQKTLLNKGYSSIEVVAWYYSYGVLLMLLVVLPTATHTRMWALDKSDLIALGYGLLLWPLAAFLLAFSNSNASPVTVMAFAPMQIIATIGLEFLWNKKVPRLFEGLGAGIVVLGLVCFMCAVAFETRASQMQAV